MSKNYYVEYINDFKKEINQKNDGELYEFHLKFPDNPYDMKSFIDAFESIFPKVNHDFENYIKILEGTNILMQEYNFLNSDLNHELFSYLSDEGLKELTHQINSHQQKEEEQENCINFEEYIEKLNEELSFDGCNSEIIEDGTGRNKEYQIQIEGQNYTTLQILLQFEDLSKHLHNGDLKKFILKAYTTAIDDFNVDEVFEGIYEQVSRQYSPTELLRMLNEDKIFFNNTIKLATLELNNRLLFSVKDPLWKDDEGDGDLLYVGSKEVIEFANDEVLFTNHPNVKFYNLADAITFLKKYNFKVIMHEDDGPDELEEWLEIFREET